MVLRVLSLVITLALLIIFHCKSYDYIVNLQEMITLIDYLYIGMDRFQCFQKRSFLQSNCFVVSFLNSTRTVHSLKPIVFFSIKRQTKQKKKVLFDRSLDRLSTLPTYSNKLKVSCIVIILSDLLIPSQSYF